MSGPSSIDAQLGRQATFDRMASAFAHADVETVSAGVRPEAVLTLAGSSWLAGTYRGYEQLTQYILGSRLVLDSTPQRVEHLHCENEIRTVHNFVVGGKECGPEMALDVTVRFHPDDRIESVLIEPRDEDAFDAAVDGFLADADSSADRST
jgi:hypothetical protein